MSVSHVVPSSPGGAWRQVDGHMRWVPDTVGAALDASLTAKQAEDQAFAKAIDVVKGTLLMDDAVRKASLTQGGSWGPGVPMSGGNLGGTNGALISRLTANLASSFGRPSDEVEAALAQQGMTWGPPFAPGRPLNPFYGVGRPPRTWDYKPGENVQVVPRWGRISFKTIRALWESYDIAQICLVPGTKIIAQRGLVPIEEIVVGDEVLTHRGRWRRVYHTMANPVGGREMRRVKAGGLDEMVMTAEHPVLAARYTHTQTRKRVLRDMEWVPAGELRSRGTDKAAPWHYDAAVLPALEHSAGMVLDLAETLGEDFSVSGGKIWRGCRVNPVPAAVPFAATLGRLLGWYLAEGSQSGGRHLQFALAATERAEAEQILADFQALFGLRGRIDPAHTGEGLEVHVNSAVVARLFACGTARTKRLPTWAWNGTRAFFTAMLDAWAKGDGCVSRRDGMVERTYVVTASEALARQMQLVAVSLGLKPSVVLHRHAEDRVPALIRGAEVHSSPTHHTVDWRSGETARTGRYSFEADGHFLATAIQEVAPSDYDGLVYNIEVEEDHSYVTTGGTVHNCTNHQINDVISLNYHFEAAQGVREDVSDEILTAREFFDSPDKEQPFRQWLYEFLINVVVLDAGCLSIRRNEAGEPIALEVVDGATILKLVDYYGRTPSDEDDSDPSLTPAGVFEGKITPAYVQVVEGMVWDWIVKDDLIYQAWHPQPNSQYGRCALEAVLLTANTDLRFQWHFLNYFTQGSIPTGFMEAPPDMSDPTQIAEWQQYWDAMMIGDQAKLRQIRFVPAGSKYSAVGAAAEKFDPEFPLYLMRRVCAAFGITPADLGFTECYSEDTECLTESGWKRIGELEVDDRVADFNPETKQIEYHVPTHRYVAPYRGEMVHFESRSVDVLVTPHHRMWAWKQTQDRTPEKRPWREYRAADLETASRFGFVGSAQYDAPDIDTFFLPTVEPTPNPWRSVVSGRFSAPSAKGAVAVAVESPVATGRAIPMDQWLEFLGYVVSEGSLTGRNHGHYNVSISQSLLVNPEKAERIGRCLEALPISWTVIDTKDGCRNWFVGDKSLWTWLAENTGRLARGKHLPDFFHHLSQRQATILLDALMLGDGTRDTRSWSTGAEYGTMSAQLADDVQELVFKLGYRVKATCNRIGFWRVGFCRGRDHQLGKEHVSRVDYDGVVWCVEVPHHLFVTRRNGKIAIQGNTVNKATSETQVDVQFRVGTMPLVRYVEGVINMFLAQHLKLRVRLRFDTAQEIEDRLAIAQAESYQIKAGVISPDEPRTRLGYPIDLNRPTPRFIDNTRNGPVPLIALMSLAGDTDPETYGPSRNAKLIDHPFVPIPGVMPPIGSQEAKDADNTSAAMQQNMIALASGKPPPFPDDETTSPPTPKQPRKNGAASKELAVTLDLLSATLALLKGQSVAAAGIAVVARDSGRVLMIQRDNVDPSKKASGRWEMPGGRKTGSEGTWEAAVREWQEETGNKLPAGDRVTEWNSDDYRLFVYAIKSESDINLNPDRQAMEVVDPDHPNAQATEVMAWWTPKDAKSAGKAIRKELRDFDWSLLSDAVEKDMTGGITAATGMTGVDLRDDDEDDDEDDASESERVALQLRQWRENARNRLRKGLAPRRFVSADLPSDLAERVWQKLETATTREDIEAAFARAVPVASTT